MITKYLYNGKEYLSADKVRQAIFDAERKAFPAEPEEEKVKFWAEYGVIYTEEKKVTPLKTLKAWKSNEIKQAFLNWRENEATLFSSLGFEIDSNERANTDINGLLIVYENNQGAVIVFRDANNVFRDLTYSQVKTLQREIVENGNHAYEQKWRLDAQVDDAKSEEDLDSVVICFEGKNFLEG